MNGVRQRIPFTFSEDSVDERLDENRILDEQEQEELIATLRDENVMSYRRLVLALQATLVASGLLHFEYLFVRSNASPLLVIFPRARPEPPLPLATPFALLALLIHLNLIALLHAERSHRFATNNIRLIPHSISFGLSVVAPSLSVLLGKSWQTTIWLSFTGIFVLIVHAVQRSIASSNTVILELEKLKYTAPGA